HLPGADSRSSGRVERSGAHVLCPLQLRDASGLRHPVSASVGYPGPPGSHSDAAATVLAPGARAVDLPSFSAGSEETGEARAGLGGLPIESPRPGPIPEPHDLLHEARLSTVREAPLPIRHCVVGVAGTDVTTVTAVRSHPSAFDQCRALLRDR